MSEIILQSGEALTQEEVLEGFALLAASRASFPLLGPEDARHAFITLMLESLDLWEAARKEAE